MAAQYCSVMQLFLVAGLLAGASAVPFPSQAESGEGVGDKWDSISSSSLTSDVVRFSNETELQLFPSTSELVHKHANSTTARRVLGDFRQCSPCTCCNCTRRWCLPTVCCYNIRCGLKGLPFGMCSFIPVSCTCYGCRS